LNDSLILIDSVDEISQLNNIKYDQKSLIISFNADVHNKLSKLNIIHKKVDEYISSEERLKIFDETVHLYDWYTKIPTSELKINEISFFEILDTAELHNFLIQKIKKIILIQKIFQQEKPTTIISNNTLWLIIKQIIDIKNTNIVLFENTLNSILAWEKIHIPINFGRKKFTIKISRHMYIKIKNLIESFLGKIFNFWYHPTLKRKSVLLLEFDPLTYSNLIKSLKHDSIDIILFNKRRPSIWNFNSLRLILKSNTKILHEKYLLDEDYQSKIQSMFDYYSKKLNHFWNDNEKLLLNIFNIDDTSFWPIIKNEFKQVFSKRLEEYILLLMISKNVFEKMNLSCIVSLNVFGETEKSILKTNSKKIPSILLEHGYVDYNSSVSRYDVLSMYSFSQDKIAVWGEIQKRYLVEFKNIDPSNILVTGSPRHDDFFLKKTNSILDSNIQTILFTFHPITETSGQSTIDLFLRLENLVIDFCNIIKNIPNLKIIVKLHPSQDEHNEKIKNLFYKIDSSIKVFQNSPILDLMFSSNFVINVSPEGFDMSTVLMESFILEKPTMNIILDNNLIQYNYVKDDAVFSIFNLDNLEKDIHEFIFNTKLQIKLINNGKLHLKKYLENPGNASLSLAKFIHSF